MACTISRWRTPQELKVACPKKDREVLREFILHTRAAPAPAPVSTAITISGHKIERGAAGEDATGEGGELVYHKHQRVRAYNGGQRSLAVLTLVQ